MNRLFHAGNRVCVSASLVETAAIERNPPGEEPVTPPRKRPFLRRQAGEMPVRQRWMTEDQMEQWVQPERLLLFYEAWLLTCVVGGVGLVALGSWSLLLGSVGRIASVVVLAIGGALVCGGSLGFLRIHRKGPEMVAEAKLDEFE